MTERISRDELVKLYKIEVTFFDSLAESGLLKTETEEGIQYVLYEELPAFERFANWHYDLEVNLPGLEVIHHLLQQLENLQSENRKLIARGFQEISQFDDM